MDSYYSNHPECLLSDPPEIIDFNHNYETTLEQHILACCKESKATQAQITRHFGSSGDAIAQQLIGNNQLIFSYNQRLITNRNLGYVHSKIKFRGNTNQNISYINQDSAEDFEESLASSALREGEISKPSQHNVIWSITPCSCYRSQSMEGAVG